MVIHLPAPGSPYVSMSQTGFRGERDLACLAVSSLAHVRPHISLGASLGGLNLTRQYAYQPKRPVT